MSGPTRYYRCDGCGEFGEARTVQGLLGPTDTGLPHGWLTWKTGPRQWVHVCSKPCAARALEVTPTPSGRYMVSFGGGSPEGVRVTLTPKQASTYKEVCALVLEAADGEDLYGAPSIEPVEASDG